MSEISWKDMKEVWGKRFDLKECYHILMRYMCRKIDLQDNLKITNSRIELFKELIKEKEEEYEE